jgi:hypothetical protein
MEGKHEVTSELASRDADIAYYADETPTRHEDAKGVSPHLVQLIEECLVIVDVAKLVIMLVISLEIPVWRRSNHKMDTLGREKGQISCVAVYESVIGDIRIH